MEKTLVCEICGKKLRNKKARAGHMWFAHQIRVGEKWNMQQEIRLLKEKLTLYYPCCICKRDIAVDLTRDDVRRRIVDWYIRDKWGHTDCIEGKKK